MLVAGEGVALHTGRLERCVGVCRLRGSREVPKGETEARGGSDMVVWRGEPLALVLLCRAPGILVVLAPVIVSICTATTMSLWAGEGSGKTRVGTRGG